MKITLPKPVELIKTLIIAFILAIVGFLLFPLLDFDTLSTQRLFSYGLLLGALLGGVAMSLKIELPGSSQVESIFVGNLAFKMPANALRTLFEEYGQVHTVRLMTDRATHKPRGFGFVEMKRKHALSAIRNLNGREVYGRELKVNIANERKLHNNNLGD